MTDDQAMGRISTLIAAVREVLETRDLSTGLLKRAAFERSVDDWIGGGDARRPATTLLMIQVGVAGAPLAERPDRSLLLDLAREVQRLLRATDIVGRVDDDTLGVLLPSTPVDQGTRAAERILETFRASDRAQKNALAATIGVSGAGNLEPWLAALQALRDARLAGGDQVVVAPTRYATTEDDAGNPIPAPVQAPAEGPSAD
jgi:GGDEF domain-containing protein